METFIAKVEFRIDAENAPEAIAKINKGIVGLNHQLINCCDEATTPGYDKGSLWKEAD